MEHQKIKNSFVASRFQSGCTKGKFRSPEKLTEPFRLELDLPYAFGKIILDLIVYLALKYFQSLYNTDEHISANVYRRTSS